MTAAVELTPHPGRTIAEEKAIDLIGAGEHHRSPRAVVDTLVADGFVIEGEKRMRDALGEYAVPTYSLSEKVRVQWEDYWCDRLEGDFE